MVDSSGAQGHPSEAGLEVFGLLLPCHEGICGCAESWLPSSNASGVQRSCND